MHQYQLLCSRIPAIFYDLDGTLADTEELLFEVWVEALAAYGAVYTLEDYLGIIGTPEDEKVPEVLKRFGIAEDPNDFYDRFMTRLKTRLAVDLKPMPGAEESLRKSRATGANIGLVTSATDWHARFVLEKLCFKQYIYPGARVTAETPGLIFRKPHPDPYLLAAKLLHVRTSGCVVFEDSVHGANAARAAGMLVVGVPHRLSPREKLEGIAHHVIPEGKTIGDFAFTDIPHLDALLPQRPR
ncbi:MAG: HAD family phosphatase [Patescibacteria group bacterium]